MKMMHAPVARRFANRPIWRSTVRTPESYLELARAFPLVPIGSEEQYDASIAVLDSLTVRDESSLDSGEAAYLAALTQFVQDYERERHAILVKPLPPLEMLQHLMKQSGMTRPIRKRNFCHMDKHNSLRSLPTHPTNRLLQAAARSSLPLAAPHLFVTGLIATDQRSQPVAVNRVCLGGTTRPAPCGPSHLLQRACRQPIRQLRIEGLVSPGYLWLTGVSVILEY